MLANAVLKQLLAAGSCHRLALLFCIVALSGGSNDIPESDSTGAQKLNAGGSPLLIPLHRETVPVLQDGKVVSMKTAYSGSISVGGPKPQEFSVVFDTGSGHLVLPSLECGSATCQAHRRYNISKSPRAIALNSDSEPVPQDELGDQVTIGFGTGSVTGEFVRESVCLGPAAPLRVAEKEQNKVCSSMSIVVAVEMSAQPFESFKFDGIFGLGLDSLALSSKFSFFSQLPSEFVSQKLPQFGIFLNGGSSEIAVGGYNQERISGSLSWAPVALPKHGFWSINIKAVRIDGVEVLDCKKGKCKGIVDTGTSHLGVPHEKFDAIKGLLSKTVSGAADCRSVEAPKLSIEINDFTLTLSPADYMKAYASRGFLGKADAKASDTELPVPAAGTSVVAGQRCQPRVMPVNMKRPLGPNLFVLGEPLLHRYYTVYDWQSKRVGFGLAKKNEHGPQHALPQPGNAEVEPLDPLDSSEEESGDRIYLMQVSLTVSLC